MYGVTAVQYTNRYEHDGGKYTMRTVINGTYYKL